MSPPLFLRFPFLSTEDSNLLGAVLVVRIEVLALVLVDEAHVAVELAVLLHLDDLEVHHVALLEGSLDFADRHQAGAAAHVVDLHEHAVHHLAKDESVIYFIHFGLRLIRCYVRPLLLARTLRFLLALWLILRRRRQRHRRR